MSKVLTESNLADRRDASAPGVKRYTVKAVWRTLQGEGVWAGRAAVFVRFVGCNMWTGYEDDRSAGLAPCSLFCDTDFRKEGSVKLSAADLVAEVLSVAGPVRFCVLTGGEPLLQADAALVKALHATGFEVACETNGTVALADAFVDAATGEIVAPDWIVCSPKLADDQIVLESCDELKLVVPDYRPSDYPELAKRVRPHRIGPENRKALWVQPEDGPRLAEAIRLAVELALADPAWRVSVQGHKALGVD